MKVHILEVIEDKDGHWVHLDSSVGNFWALWGDGRPNVGYEYHVELEIDQPLRLGQLVSVTDTTVFAIRGNDRNLPIVMVGRITHIFPAQGTLRLQVGESALVLAFEGQVSPDSWIQCEVSRLIVYNDNY